MSWIKMRLNGKTMDWLNTNIRPNRGDTVIDEEGGKTTVYTITDVYWNTKDGNITSLDLILTKND